MNLEARVAVLEENRVHWDQVLTGIEGTVALILKEQMTLKDKVAEHDRRFDKIDLRLEKMDQRFNKMEELLIQIVNHLAR